jgi:hypothetical protein
MTNRQVSSARDTGQALIMFVLCLVVVIGFTSLALDIGLFYHERQNVQNAVDAAALAGAQELPDQGTNAQSIAEKWALSNDSDLDAAGLDVSFRCIIGDRDGNNVPDWSDVPVVCNPGAGAQFTCTSNKICWSKCDFSAPSNKCNTIVVGADKDVPFYFSPVLSTLGNGDKCFHDECNTGTIRGAACRGACGGPPSEPLDVVLVIDRTYSLCTNSSTPCSGAGLANLNAIKDGARAVLQMYNPSLQHVALVVLPKSNPFNDCTSVTSNSAAGNWLITPFNSNYNVNGVLNSGSELVSNVNCLQMATNYGTQTDLGNPMIAASNHLQTNGRPGVKKAIIFLTDGAANQPQFSTPGASTGYMSCTAQAAVATGDLNGFEVNPSNGCTDGAGSAADMNSGTTTSTSCTDGGKDRHVFQDYNINVPAGANITGITVRLDAWADSSSGTRRLCAELSWDGGVTWTAPQETDNLPTSSSSSDTLGSNSEEWGRAWTPADFTNGNFRLRLTSVGSSNSRDFFLDWAAVNVHYQDPGIPLGSCHFAAQQAEAGKNAGIEVFTIGFGVEGETCRYDNGSPYKDAIAPDLLADMATDSKNDKGNCSNAANVAAENADGDHFLCEAKGGDLESIFKQAAEQLAQGSKMVPVYE